MFEASAKGLPFKRWPDKTTVTRRTPVSAFIVAVVRLSDCEAGVISDYFNLLIMYLRDGRLALLTLSLGVRTDELSFIIYAM